MIPSSNPKLARLYAFFDEKGPARLQGLDDSYFSDFNQAEREEAWGFLKEKFWLSTDCIAGLYLIDPLKAVELFKTTLELPCPISPYVAMQEALEGNRLLMLSYVNKTEFDEKYVNSFIQFSESKFPKIRAEFASAIPTSHITPALVDALKSMIFTETERVPLTNAITKLMVIHGLDFDAEDPLYKSIYLSLRSDDVKEKKSAMLRLEKLQTPDFR
jgi:hypothetical protein